MTEADSIVLVTLPNTKESLVTDLKALGVKEGDIVLAHASMSKLGWTVGREVTVIDALIEAVGESGTLIMPSQTGDNSDPKAWQNPPVPQEWIEMIKANMPPFDPLRTPTRAMGKVVEALLHYPNVMRSNHPQVSFCGYGKYAKEILSDHQLTPGLGDGSPLKKLYDRKAKILLLGVGYGNCTALHLSESHQENMTWIDTGASVLHDNQVQWLDFKEMNYSDEDFEALGIDYELTAKVAKGKVGASLCRYIDLQDLCDFADKWFKKNRK